MILPTLLQSAAGQGRSRQGPTALKGNEEKIRKAPAQRRKFPLSAPFVCDHARGKPAESTTRQSPGRTQQRRSERPLHNVALPSPRRRRGGVAGHHEGMNLKSKSKTFVRHGHDLFLASQIKSAGVMQRDDGKRAFRRVLRHQHARRHAHLGRRVEPDFLPDVTTVIHKLDGFGGGVARRRGIMEQIEELVGASLAGGRSLARSASPGPEAPRNSVVTPQARAPGPGAIFHVCPFGTNSPPGKRKRVPDRFEHKYFDEQKRGQTRRPFDCQTARLARSTSCG